MTKRVQSYRDPKTFINMESSSILIIFRYIENCRFINVDRKYRTKYQFLITKPVTFYKRVMH